MEKTGLTRTQFEDLIDAFLLKLKDIAKEALSEVLQEETNNMIKKLVDFSQQIPEKQPKKSKSTEGLN